MPPNLRDKMLMRRIAQNRQQIAKKYTKKSNYNIKVINDIIYNEKSNIVAVFKDYLILDDTSEFLKRFYKKNEVSLRLIKIFSFYDSYSKIFPNYTKIKESKYLYKNIQKKQKMIDNINKGKKSKKEEIPLKNIKEDKVFDSRVYESILNHTNISHKNRQNQSEHPTETNTSFENLINFIGDAEKKSNNLTCEDNQNEILHLIKNKVNNLNIVKDKSKLFLTKEKISINEYSNNEKNIIYAKEKNQNFSPNLNQNTKEETLDITRKTSAQNENQKLSTIQISSKSIKNIAKTERNNQSNLHLNMFQKKDENQMNGSKYLKEKSVKSSAKSELGTPNGVVVPKIINNFNIINNIQNIIQAPPLILSATASTELTKDLIKYNSNNNSLHHTIHQDIQGPKINSSNLKMKYKAMKSNSTKVSQDFANFKHKFGSHGGGTSINPLIRAESINRGSFKKALHKEIDENIGSVGPFALNSERSNFVSALNSKREINNKSSNTNYLTADAGSKGQLTIRAKEFSGSRQMIIKEKGENLNKNLVFSKNVNTLKDVFKKINSKENSAGNNKFSTLSPNAKMSTPLKIMDGTQTSRFYFNKTALKMGNVTKSEKLNVMSERSKR